MIILVPRLPPGSPLFPYTTLFRSRGGARRGDDDVAVGEPVLCQLGAQRVASRVVPDHRDQPALGADRRHVRGDRGRRDRKSTRLNSSHVAISYAVFCLKKKKKKTV